MILPCCCHVLSLWLGKLGLMSGITSGRVLDGELLYTKTLEVTLFAFAYTLFHRDFSIKVSRYQIATSITDCKASDTT